MNKSERREPKIIGVEDYNDDDIDCGLFITNAQGWLSTHSTSF